MLWLGFGAEIFSIFFALTVLSGRVYAQSYWNVFGLSPDSANISLINYAIISPNTAVASVLLAIGVVVLIALLKRQVPDFAGKNNPRLVYFFGFALFLVGLFFFGLIPTLNTSRWTDGTAGLAFGLSYLGFIGGPIMWTQAGARLESRGPPKWEIAIFRWLKNVPFILLQMFIVISVIASTLWGMLNTAQEFGANEAKEMFINKPDAVIQLDSIRGFDDFASISAKTGIACLPARIILGNAQFLYVIIRDTANPLQLYVRAIPIQRVQAIQYTVGMTPIGK